MKTNFRFLALSAAILSMFTACQREELEQNQKPETLTHSVTFVAGAPETKTIATIEGNTVNYAWTADDENENENRFTVFENGVPATEVLAELDTEGKMSMTATFSGDVPASPKYQALYNSEVSANQNIVKNSYAEESDVMVSNVLDGTRNDNFIFSFKREVAFAKMTLKCLTSGAYVSSVKIESDKPIAGEYDLETGTFVNTSNVITLDVLTDVANGNATVWFTTIPVEDAKFTITAETTNDLEAVAATYTKTFSKTITLTRGNVKGFGVAMVELVDPKKDQTISFDPTSYTATIGKENTYPTLTAQSTGAKTWTSSNTEVATIDGTTGEITLVAAGTTTISVTVAGDDTYNAGTGSYELTVENAPIVSTETWSLVTDASSLALGDVIVIVAADANVAMSKTQNDNNRGQQTITKNADNTVTIDDNVQQLTLGAGKTTGTFSLSTGSGYLYAASSSKNYLKTQTELDDNGSWAITIENNVATIKANGKNTRNLLKYNSSSSIFSCYESGQGAVQIYRDTRAVQSISYLAKTGSIDKYTLVKNIPTLDESGVKTSVSYTSSDATVATVSESGEITPLKAGTTTITAIAAASAEYREAKASFVLTVTDSSPYLRATASKTSVAATGEPVTITVDTNVENWTAISDNAAFVVGTPSGNTVDVVVSKNTDASERTATITVTAGTLSETITLTQRAAGAAAPASITINSSTKNFPSSYGSANTFSEYTLNGLKYKIQQVYVNGTKLQWRASGHKNGTGTMYNSEEMPAGIASIVITFNSDDNNKNHTVKIGNSANPTSATSITPTKNNNVYTYTCDGSSKYFVITNGTGAGYIDSIVINFE